MTIRRIIGYAAIAHVLFFLVSLTCSHAQVTTVTTTNVAGKQPDSVLFERAVNSIQKARYAEARALLETLIENYADSDYVPRAKLSIGDAWYAEGSLKRAEMEYQDFITFFPNRPEIAATKLKIEAIHKKAKS